MNPSIKNVIRATVSQVIEKGGYVTKTKLLKLLYLLDVEYYRTHRRTFTGFNWKFFHLGPWAREFEPLIEELVGADLLVETASTKQDYETRFYRSSEPVDTRGLFESFADEAILRSIINTWAEAPTGEILDYVYFHTEPMERGIRNESLDFNCITQEKPEKYTRPQSGIPEKDIRRLRRTFQEAQKESKRRPKFVFTAPRYDEEFEKAFEKIEAADL